MSNKDPFLTHEALDRVSLVTDFLEKEALDRVSLVTDFLEKKILNHGYFEDSANKEAAEKVEKAVDLLLEVYTSILTHDATTNSVFVVSINYGRKTGNTNSSVFLYYEESKAREEIRKVFLNYCDETQINSKLEISEQNINFDSDTEFCVLDLEIDLSTRKIA